MRRFVLFLGIMILLWMISYSYSKEESAGSESAVGSRQPVVVLDAGHGGNDPGKVGTDGCLEKEINLEIVRRLQRYLEMSDIRVILTRDSDRSLHDEGAKSRKSSDLKNRCSMIEDSGCDLAVSIHQNSFEDASESGGQVFYLKSSEEGKVLAEEIQNALHGMKEQQKKRTAGGNEDYYLLRHVTCPMVIVECGFLSNPEEAALLQSPEYQDRLAYTIHLGIVKFLEQYRI